VTSSFVIRARDRQRNVRVAFFRRELSVALVLADLPHVGEDIEWPGLTIDPDQFKTFAEAVSLMMKTRPNCSVHDLAQISVPVAIAQSEHDEFIKREHAEYLARSIPKAELVVLHGVSHFAPLQRPEQFNIAMLAFLGKALRASPHADRSATRDLKTLSPLRASAFDRVKWHIEASCSSDCVASETVQ
jgi:pimeloyl-ACP methyl ester carboxylesterase